MEKRGMSFRGKGKIKGMELKEAKKAAAEMDFMAYFIIAIIMLAIGIVAYLFFSGKLSGFAEYIKNMFRNIFGG